MTSAPSLFDVIARLQGALPWGSLLDAGTGAASARWAGRLPTARWTGVSADAAQLEYDLRWVDLQLAFAAQSLGRARTPGLQAALMARSTALRLRAVAIVGRVGGLPCGHDYLIAAEAIGV